MVGRRFIDVVFSQLYDVIMMDEDGCDVLC